MVEDEIMAEVRAIRDAYAKEFNYDVRAIYEDAKEREKTTPHKLVSLEPKRLKPSESSSGGQSGVL